MEGEIKDVAHWSQVFTNQGCEKKVPKCSPSTCFRALPGMVVEGNLLGYQIFSPAEGGAFDTQERLFGAHLSRFLDTSPWAPSRVNLGLEGRRQGVPRGLVRQRAHLPDFMGLCFGSLMAFCTASRNSSVLSVRFYFLNKYSIFIQLGLGKPWLQSPNELQQRAKSLCLRFQETIQLSLQSPQLSEAGLLLLLFSLPLLFWN